MGEKMKFKVKAKPKGEGAVKGASAVPGTQAASFGTMPQFTLPAGGGDGSGITLILKGAKINIEKLIIKKKD